jgi:restriction endonuclease Mrr
MKERVGDYDTVFTDESRIENRIAWTRQNLKDKDQLAMPERGTWQITRAGVERLKMVAVRSLKWEVDLLDISWQRFSPEFLARLQELGRKLQGAQ